MEIQASLLAMAERLEAYARAAVMVRNAYEEISRSEGIGPQQAGDKSPPLDNLTPKEREIYDLITQGLEPREIAAKLEKSLKTIEAQRDTLRKKLGFASSHDLTKAARRS